MRKDMAKVIVERPRRGSADRVRKGRTRPLEDSDGDALRTSKGQARQPVNRAQKTKSLNENLAPLRRFLHAQVGRPWDKVYAEICENLRASNTVQQHVRDHVGDFVAIRTRMKDGKVVIADGWRGADVALADTYQKLYVHPRTGLLRKNEHWRSHAQRYREARQRERDERHARVRVIDAKTQLHRLDDDAWYEVTLARIGKDGAGVAKPIVDAVYAAKLSALQPHALYGKQNVYAAGIARLSKADLKGYDLHAPKRNSGKRKRV
jgi:hypothetical protein